MANLTPISTDMAENAVIYEANIRQYSPQGTFNAFTKDIPVLKELGVKIIWVMPINPISKVKRKAKGNLFTSEIEDPHREKITYVVTTLFLLLNAENLGGKYVLLAISPTRHKKYKWAMENSTQIT